MNQTENSFHTICKHTQALQHDTFLESEAWQKQPLRHSNKRQPCLAALGAEPWQTGGLTSQT